MTGKMSIWECLKCHQDFSSRLLLERHLNATDGCEMTLEKKEIVSSLPIKCICGKSFTYKNNFYHHRKYRCKHPSNQVTDRPLQSNPEILNEISALKKKIIELETMQKTQHTEVKSEITHLKEHPRNNQNVLQVVCVGDKDNYLDMLTEQFDDFDRALEYVKDCALSSLSGDCKLIKKIYFDNGNHSIRYIDKNKQKIGYLDKNRQKIVDIKGVLLGRRLANSLQNSYLKGVNYLTKQDREKHFSSEKFLDDYDIQSWNHHIYELSDTKYQRKLINNLDIPIVTD